MNVDRELDWQVLASDWQALEQPLPPQSLERLAARVRARGRLLATWVVGECTFAAVAIAVLLRLAINADNMADSVAMWSLAAIAASTTAFGLWNWRGAWRPVAASHQAYIDLSIARCARLRRAASTGYWVLAAEVMCFVPWIAARLINSGAGLRGYAGAYLYLGAFVAGAILALRAIHRWVTREEDAVRGFGEVS